MKLESESMTLEKMKDVKKRLTFEASRSQYPEYADALERIERLEEELRGTVMLIAQADTGKHLRRTSGRFALLVIDAQALTRRYGFFKYWDDDDV